MDPIEIRREGHFVESGIVMESDTLPDNNGLGEEGYVTMSLGMGQDATRPGLQGRDEEQNVAGESCQVTPSTGEKGRVLFRDEVGGDDLMDARRPTNLDRKMVMKDEKPLKRLCCQCHQVVSWSEHGFWMTSGRMTCWTITIFPAR